VSTLICLAQYETDREDWRRLGTALSDVGEFRIVTSLTPLFIDVFLLAASGNAGGIIIFCLLLASLCGNLYFMCRGAVVVSFRDHPICNWPRRIRDRCVDDDVNQGGEYQQAESAPRTISTTMTPLLSRHREAPPEQSAVVLDVGRCTALYAASDTGAVPKRHHAGGGDLLEGASSVGCNLQVDLEAGPARATGYRRRRRHSTEEHELTTF
jgi:hypothetical protein